MVAALIHELVELGLVFCLTQTLQEVQEFLLLVFQFSQRLGLLIRLRRPD